MEKEIWKPVKGYEGFYEISTFGNIRSLDRIIINSKGVKRMVKSSIPKSRKSNRGYLRIQLHKNGTSKEFSIHRLVAEAFIPNPNNLPCVNHKDENPLNNHVDNLEWCTYKYNSNYGTSRERLSKSKRKNRPVLQLDLHGNVIKEFPTLIEVRDDGFLPSNVGDCCRGIGLSYKGFLWVFKKDKENIPNIVKRNITTPKAIKPPKSVLVYSKNGILVKTFRTVKDAAKYYGTCMSTITNYCTIRPNNRFNLIFKFTE